MSPRYKASIFQACTTSLDASLPFSVNISILFLSITPSQGLLQFSYEIRGTQNLSMYHTYTIIPLDPVTLDTVASHQIIKRAKNHTYLNTLTSFVRFSLEPEQQLQATALCA